MTETLVVPRAQFEMDEPWATPPQCSPFRLRRATDAAAPRLATSVALWYDEEYLTILFSATDDHICASYGHDDDPLYEQDVVEAFLAPDTLERYFELEVNPQGAVFDAAIESPAGTRANMRADAGWTCKGRFVALRKIIESSGVMSIDTVLRIPFAALECPVPIDGEIWRGNFFRIDRHPEHGDEFSAWQPTMRVPPDFHVTAVFGVLRFAE